MRSRTDRRWSQASANRSCRFEALEHRRLLSIGGAVFEDLDRDGVRDAGEPGLENWSVELQRLGSPGTLLETFEAPKLEGLPVFGESMAVDGDRILMGASWFGDGIGEGGTAYLIEGTTGDLLHVFRNPSPNNSDLFGSSVALSGDRVLIGATGDDSLRRDAGAAYLFDATSGELLQTLTSPISEQRDYFGSSVALVGDMAIVGAPGEDQETMEDVGAVYQFDVASSDLLQRFANPTPAEGDQFGSTMATFGDDVLVSAPGDDVAGGSRGVVHWLDGSTGQLRRTLLKLGSGSGGFSSAIAAEGNLVLVGAESDSTHGLEGGAAYLFNALTGNVVQEFHNPTPDYRDRFGSSVAIVGDLALIGAYRNDTSDSDAGSAYLFHIPTGRLLTRIDNPLPADGEYFGRRVAIVDGRLLISSRGIATNGSNIGVIYSYTAGYDPASAVTDQQGDYLFTSVESGTYVVRQIIEEGYVATYPDGDGAHTVVVIADEHRSGLDFGSAERGDVNEPPTAEDDHYDMDQGQGLMVSAAGVLANDADADWDAISAMLVDDVSRGTLALEADGSFTYTPDDDFFGTDRFTYRAHDGQENSNVATVTILVYGEPKLLTSSEATELDWFGSSVTIDGDRAVVGTLPRDNPQMAVGSARVFHRQLDGTWLETAVLTPADASAARRLGPTVALDGNTLAVGGDAGSGVVYVFEYLGDGTWQETARLAPEDDTPASFGDVIGIDGDRIVVGTRDDHELGTNAGSVYVFRRAANGSWYQSAKLFAPGDPEHSHFGRSVAVEGNRLAVGAYGTATAYVLEENPDETWTNVAQLAPLIPGQENYFGHSVALSVDRVLVGAYDGTRNGNVDGAAYIFQRGVDESWVQVARLVASDAQEDDHFGIAVALQGDCAVVTANGRRGYVLCVST